MESSLNFQTPLCDFHEDRLVGVRHLTNGLECGILVARPRTGIVGEAIAVAGLQARGLARSQRHLGRRGVEVEHGVMAFQFHKGFPVALVSTAGVGAEWRDVAATGPYKLGWTTASGTAFPKLRVSVNYE